MFAFSKLRKRQPIIEPSGEGETASGGAAELSMATEPAVPADANRYKRGSLVYATDGPIGTLRQIVIDDERAEVKALVVRMKSRNEPVLVPIDLVYTAVGSTLLLNVTRAQFEQGARRSPRMDPKMFVGAKVDQAENNIRESSAGTAGGRFSLRRRWPIRSTPRS